MNHQKLFLFYTILISLLSNSLYIQASGQTSPQEPRHYRTRNFQTPLSMELLAAFDGTMKDWSIDQIQRAATQRHPDSGDTIAHLAHDEETFAKIISASPGLLNSRNEDSYTPVHNIARRPNSNFLAIALAITQAQSPLALKSILNEPVKYGDTIVHVPAKSINRTDHLNILYQYGANLHLPNYDGQTPLKLANRRNRRSKKHRNNNPQSNYAPDITLQQQTVSTKPLPIASTLTSANPADTVNKLGSIGDNDKPSPTNPYQAMFGTPNEPLSPLTTYFLKLAALQ